MSLWPFLSELTACFVRLQRGEKVIPRPATTAFKRRAIALSAAILGFGAFSALAQSASVTLAWNPVTSGGVTGYRVYQGTGTRAYSNASNAGNLTQTTISGLTNGTTYYFAVVAYNAAGLESDFSTEVSYTQVGPRPPSGLVFAANSGTISAPFTVSNGVVSQSIQTPLTGSGRAAYGFTIDIPGPYLVSASVN